MTKRKCKSAEAMSADANKKLAKRPKWLKTLANMKRGDSMRSRDKPLRMVKVTLAKRFNPEDWK